MAKIIAPAFLGGPAGMFLVQSAELLPLYQAVVAPPGALLEFSAPGETKDLPVPIPRLAGLDDIEIERVGFELSSADHEEDASVAGQPASGAVTLAYGGASAAAVRLKRIEIENLRIAASPADNWVVEGDGAAGSLARVVYAWDAAQSATVTTPNGAAGSGKYIHLLVRPAQSGGFGAPAAAAPAFAMPGSGGGMYGPALGGASLSLFHDGSNNVKAVLRLNPPLAGGRVSLLLGHANKTNASEGLPNEVTAVTSWTAANVKAVFDVRPSSVVVKAQAAAAGGDQPAVAQFPSGPGDTPVGVDFAPVARSLLKKAYPLSQASDLGLKLLFTAETPGVLRVNLGAASARYLSRPLAHGPAQLKLLGAPESLELAVAPAFKPSAVSFTIDGVYGPARLTLDSDTAVPDARHGFRVAGAIQIARRVALTGAEANLPIVRLGLYGRASEDSELLLSLHKGDEMRIGAEVAAPLSLEAGADSLPAWQRVEYPAPGLLPPHATSLWLVVRATRGVFWWHGAPDPAGSTQRSDDAGGAFAEVAGRPLLHVSVKEIDPPSGNPCPLHPVSLVWRDGQLNPDVVGVQGQEASLPPEFRRFWIAEGAASQTFLQGIAALGGLLRLTLACQRDVDLTVSEAVLTYDPWNA